MTTTRFTMKADILRQSGDTSGGGGYWNTYQDPDTGEMIRVWVEGVADDPNTPTVDETTGRETFLCMARNVKSDGMRVNATTEDWGEIIGASDYVNIWYPPNVNISRRDRITNIRHYRTGQVYWMEEEFDVPEPTVFDVIGVEPKFDAFGNLVEWKATLERAEVQ